MCTTLLNSWNWAQAEFGGAALGDVRRNRRLIKVASTLAQNPSGAMHGAITAGHELKAAYRLLESDEATFENITAPHHQRTRQALQEPGEYLLVEDTTSLDFTSHAALQGAGRIGDDGGRGFFLHSTLALRIENWNESHVPQVTAVGLFAQTCWARTMPTVGQGKEKKSARLARPRESQRWAAAFENSKGPPQNGRWTMLGDREADIYETFNTCSEQNMDWIIRANQPRALEEQSGSVFDAVAQSASLGLFEIELRARPGQKKRCARLEVRSAAVTVRPPWRPGGKLEALKMNVVEVREIDAPAGTEAIHWVLLTSWPAANFVEALRVAKTYTQRWLIEEYHKALKTGAGVEECQLMFARSVMALTGILGIVAVRLLNMKLLAKTKGACALEVESVDPDALLVLEKKFGKPEPGWTNRSLLVAIAQVGGFLARKNDGDPGWLSIWRGWHTLTIMIQGFNLARAERSG